MLYRKLGNSSLMASVLGVGALHFGVFCNQDESSRIIHRAMDLGVNFIDTAPMYGSGNSENYVKNAIKGRRGEVILATKVGLEPNFLPDKTFGVRVVPLSKEVIRRSVEKSLMNLGTDYIDLYQVHAFDASTPMEETLEALAELIKEGKILFAGCSNYDSQELNCAVAVADKKKLLNFVSLQCHYNLIERRAEQEIIPACIERNCSVICYRALGRGILTGQYKKEQPLPAGSRAQTSNRVRRWLTDDTLRLTQALETFAQARGRTLTELAIAWLLARPAVGVVLVGMRNLQHLETCSQAVAWQLSETEEAAVELLIKNLNLTEQVRSLPETFLEK